MHESKQYVKFREKSIPCDKDGLFWHFTKTEVLPLIMKNGLWAGHTSFMDDPLDCQLSNLLRTVMLDLCLKILPHMIPSVLVQRETQKTVSRQFCIGGDIPTFILCLTADLNNDKLWEIMTRDGGFAIGINAAKFCNVMTLDPHVMIDKCDYGNYTKISRMFNSWKRKIESVGNRLARETDVTKRLEILQGVREMFEGMKDLSRQMAFTKRNKYRKESELRVAYIFEDEVPEYQLHYIGAKPFVESLPPLDLKNVVERIVVSPRGDKAKSEIVATFVGKSIGLEVGERTKDGLFTMRRPVAGVEKQGNGE